MGTRFASVEASNKMMLKYKDIAEPQNICNLCLFLTAAPRTVEERTGC